MKKIIKRKSSPIPQENKPDITALINKMQEQLASLEKKIDTLVSQSSKKPAEEKHFSKPFQRFDRPRHHDRSGRDNNFRERSFTRVICSDCSKECEVPFKPSADRPVYCKECFAKRKDNRGQPQVQVFIPEHRPDKQKHRESRRPSGKRKQPGFRRRKE